MRYGTLFLMLIMLLIALPSMGRSLEASPGGLTGTDERPELEWVTHSLANLISGVLNEASWGDTDGIIQSMAWPAGTGNSYLWWGSIWTCCYGEITSMFPDSAGKWASIADYGDWELWPSDGYPMTYQTPGAIATEESWYASDDWYVEGAYQEAPYGMMVNVKNLSWDVAGYDNIMATEMVFTHHSEYGNPGTALEGFVPALRADCDIAIADSVECAMDDLVYYDGHAIWANGTYDFEYLFNDGTPASTQDEYTYQQNPDSPLDPSDPDNIYYYYNYLGSDGIPDNDVDMNGVSDHFTILAKVVGSDTLYITDTESGIQLFSQGMPYFHYDQVVGDTTFLVVPRNLSYMWDGDGAGSSDDDSGEQDLSVPCNGFLGWRLLDLYVLKADDSIERPADIWGCPIPLGHSWWNWESDPGTDPEVYDIMWGQHPDFTEVPVSGPAYMADWYGNPNTPSAVEFTNPGPFPIVINNPLAEGFPTFDYRFLISAGVCTLEDGDELHVIGGWVIGRGLAGLRMNADLMLDAFYRDGAWGQGMGISESNGSGNGISLRVYPNPFRGGNLSVNFALGAPVSGTLAVYDLSGRIVAETAAEDLQAGSNTLSIDGSRLGSGIYFAVVRTPDTLIQGKFAVVQ